MIPSRHEDHQGTDPHVPLLPRRVRPTGRPGGAVPALPQAAHMSAADRIQRGVFGVIAVLALLTAVVVLIRVWWPS